MTTGNLQANGFGCFAVQGSAGGDEFLTAASSRFRFSRGNYGQARFSGSFCEP